MVRVTFWLANKLINVLEIFTISDKSIAVLVGQFEALLSVSALDLDVQEGQACIHKLKKLLKVHFSVFTMTHFVSHVSLLQTHLGTVSLEEEITLNRTQKLTNSMKSTVPLLSLSSRNMLRTTYSMSLISECPSTSRTTVSTSQVLMWSVPLEYLSKTGFNLLQSSCLRSSAADCITC